ncbi:MAG: chemotaxis protein CheB [Ruminococcus sp.]|nr:chemotaxis protein CheB [Ruminococcus sp.]
MSIKILVISDDSAFKTMALRIISENSAGKYNATGCALKDGRKSAIAISPAYILLDADCPDASADYLIKLVPRYSVPVVVCTTTANIKYTMLQSGAMDVITKHADNPRRFAERLMSSIARNASERKALVAKPKVNFDAFIAIGGSTGSTEALREIIKGLSGELPPMAAVLHMPDKYTAIYAEQLNSITDYEVVEASSGLYMKPNRIVIAAGGKHLRLFRDKKGYFVTSEAGVRVSGHCPSVDVFFDSVAYTAKANAIGVILTGMGQDGAKGMLTMKKMGAYNIGQDEASSVVYGMPRAAFENGAVKKQCSLDKIAGEIMNLSRKISKGL